MPQHIIDTLNKVKEDLEFEERFLSHEFWDEIFIPLDQRWTMEQTHYEGIIQKQKKSRRITKCQMSLLCSPIQMFTLILV